MSLKYACPGCGTSLGYEGLCWKCKSEQERKAALAWTPEQMTNGAIPFCVIIRLLHNINSP